MSDEWIETATFMRSNGKQECASIHSLLYLPSSFVRIYTEYRFRFMSWDYDTSPYVDLGLELRDGLHGTWSNDNLTALHLLTFDTAQKGAHIVTSFALRYGQ